MGGGFHRSDEMKLKTILLLPALMLVLIGCNGEVAPLPTYTPYPTNTPVPSSPTSNNSSPITYFEKGNDYFKQGDYQKAIEQYDEAIRLNPQYAKAYYNRGIAYYYLSQYEQAIQDFGEAIRLNPQYAEAYNNRGFAYETLGKSTEAERDFAKAKELGFDP